MRLVARRAAFDEQLALARGIPERLAFRINVGRAQFTRFSHDCRSNIKVAAP